MKVEKKMYDALMSLNETQSSIYSRNYEGDYGNLIIWAGLKSYGHISGVVEIGRVVLNPNKSTTINLTIPMYSEIARCMGMFHAKLKYDFNIVKFDPGIIVNVSNEAAKLFHKASRMKLNPEEELTNLATCIDIEQMHYLNDYDYVFHDVESKRLYEILGYQPRFVPYSEIECLEE